MCKKAFFITLLCLIVTACSNEKNTKDDSTKPTGRVPDYVGTLHFLNEEGETISTLRYAKAETELERNQGLMDVREMPKDAGMVFFFENEEPLSFWMANTPLPLDIMYVNSDSVIVSIYQNTTPFSDKTLPSFEPAKYVIETNAGYSINHDIREGLKVRF